MCCALECTFWFGKYVFFFFWGIFPFWGTGCCGLSADWIAMFQSQLGSRWILIKVYLDKVLVIYRDPYEGLGYSCIFFHPLSFVNFVVWQTLTRFGPHCCSPLKRVSGPHKSCSSLSWQPNMWSFIVFPFFCSTSWTITFFFWAFIAIFLVEYRWV